MVALGLAILAPGPPAPATASYWYACDPASADASTGDAQTGILTPDGSGMRPSRTFHPDATTPTTYRVHGRDVGLTVHSADATTGACASRCALGGSVPLVQPHVACPIPAGSHHVRVAASMQAELPVQAFVLRASAS